MKISHQVGQVYAKLTEDVGSFHHRIKLWMSTGTYGFWLSPLSLLTMATISDEQKTEILKSEYFSLEYDGVKNVCCLAFKNGKNSCTLQLNCLRADGWSLSSNP